MEAIDLLANAAGQARILAGGTDLMPELRSSASPPEILVDITRIPDLQGITISPDWVSVGAAVSFAEIKGHPYLQRNVPVLVDAASSIGGGGIQQAATWVGNIVQAMPAADGAIAALALEAEAQIVKLDSETWIPVEDLFLGPGKSIINPARELITAIRFPLPAKNILWGTAWRRIGRRTALILPILNCAVKLVLNPDASPNRIHKTVLAMGPAGSRPFRAKKAEQFLIGKHPEANIFTQAGELAKKEAQPRSSPLRASKEYRRAIIPMLIEEALQEAYQRTQRVEIRS